MLFFTLLFLSLLLCLWFLSIYFDYGDFPVYPGRIPFIGHLYKMPKNSNGNWRLAQELSDKCLQIGGVVMIYFGIIPIYLITDPDAYLKLLNVEFHKPSFMKRFTKFFLGNGLLFGPVSVWKGHRKMFNPTFNQQVLDGFVDDFNYQSRILIDEFETMVGKGSFDPTDFIQKNSLRTICATTMGVDISGDEDKVNQYMKSYQNVWDVFVDRFVNPLYLSEWIYKKSKLKIETENCVKKLHDFAEMIRQQKRKEISEKPETGFADTTFKPFIYKALEEENINLSLQDIKDEINVMILTGFETSASVLVFILLLVGAYPHVQERIYNEIDEIFGNSGRDVTKEDLSKLQYVEAVFKETTRFWPVVPVIARALTQDVQLNKGVLKEGYVCVVLLRSIMRHSIWGPDADQFMPERWLDPRRLPKNANAYAAFSYGKRNCIGKTYAIMSIKVALVHIFRRYKVFGDASNVEMKLEPALKACSGHHISIEHRNKNLIMI